MRIAHAIVRRGVHGRGHSALTSFATGLLLCVILLPSTRLGAATADAENFEYFARPYTMLSDFAIPEETQVTPEGSLRTHCGTFSFFIGDDLTSLNQPLKRLRDGWLPIVEYSTEGKDVTYRFHAFALAAPELGKVPYKASLLNLNDYFKVVKINNLVNYIRIEAVNRSATKARLRVAAHYELGNGIPMQVDYLSREFIYFDWKGRGFRLSNDGSWYGDGKEILSVLRPAFAAQEDKFVIQRELEPKASATIDILLPYFPVQQRDLNALRRLSFENALERKIQFWQRMREQTLAIDIAEQKPLDTFYASQMYILEGCLDYVGGRYILRANPFQYDQFYIRDATQMVLALDASGVSDVAEKCLDHFLESQDEKGRFASQKTQYDANGQALYALGEHYKFTRDEKWARRVLPRVVRSMAWLYNFRENAPSGKGLLPESAIHDNEQIQEGHIVGDNLWALAGMRGAITIARGAGKEQITRIWESQYDEYLHVVRKLLAETASKNRNIVTPAFEGFEVESNVTGRYDKKYGFDWGNLGIVYPSRALDPFDAATNSSVSYWRGLFREGLFPYPEDGNENLVHHYLTTDITQTNLIRGETAEVVNDLYEGYLLHTTNTQAGCERINLALRDFQPPSNITPHGTFAAKYMLLFRNLLVREDGDDLHLLSCLSPAWVKPGASIECRRAPTYFGETSFVFDIRENGGRLQLSAPRRNPPARIIVHLPDWLRITAAVCDNTELKIASGNAVTIPPNSRSLAIAWTEEPHADISFNTVLNRFLEREKSR